jgi:hypothetical protein
LVIAAALTVCAYPASHQKGCLPDNRQRRAHEYGEHIMRKNKIFIGATILLFSSTAAVARSQGARAVLRVCKPDIRQFCANWRAGG